MAGKIPVTPGKPRKPRPMATPDAMVSAPAPGAPSAPFTSAASVTIPAPDTMPKTSSDSPSYPSNMKENIMATAFETTNETVKHFNESAEAAMTNGKAAMEQVAAKAKDAAEASMKSIEEMTDAARGNVEALLASARLTAAGFETLAAHISDVSRKSFETTTTAARALTSAKTPTELFQLQSDFAKTQFDSAVAEFSKMTEMLVKLSGEVMEPVQNRVAITTDKIKSAFSK